MLDDNAKSQVIDLLTREVDIFKDQHYVLIDKLKMGTIKISQLENTVISLQAETKRLIAEKANLTTKIEKQQKEVIT